MGWVVCGGSAQVWYTLFSATYWAAGGIGACRPRIDDWANATDPCPQPDPCADFLTSNINDCTVVCDRWSDRTLIIPSYIYPILDWGDKPGEALAIVVGGCLVMPVMQVLTSPTIVPRASGGPSPN